MTYKNLLLFGFLLITLSFGFQINKNIQQFQQKSPKQILDQTLSNILKQRSLMGIQYQITNKTNILYHNNLGFRDGKNPIQNSTIFRVASLSKSVTASSLMLLVQQKKIKLTDQLTTVLGFQVKNPYFPNVPITIEKVLSHQAGFVQCQPYYTNFLMDGYNAKSGYQVPDLKQILTQNGKYYNKCLFDSKNAPGTHYQYVNLDFGIAGTIVQKISGVRFDIFARQNILQHISQGQQQVATFNVATIKNISNLGITFIGKNGQWQYDNDYYPQGIVERNLTGYTIGKNGLIFGPQGGLRASVSHLSNYVTMLSNGGVTKNGKRVLSKQSVSQLIKPRYQYHGKLHGGQVDDHLYGFGTYTSTYRTTDQVISHQVVRGHTGSAYGLISANYWFNNFTMTYIVNGALNGYDYDTGTIFQKQRLLLNKALQEYYYNQLV